MLLAYSKESLDVRLGHSWFDVLHDEDMRVAADGRTVFHQLYFLGAFFELNLVDDIVQSSSVDEELGEPVEAWAERRFPRVGVHAFPIDVDHGRIGFCDERLKIAIIVNGVDLEVFLVLWQLQNFHPVFQEVRLLFGEDVDAGVADFDQRVAARLVHSCAPPEIRILDEVVLLV